MNWRTKMKISHHIRKGYHRSLGINISRSSFYSGGNAYYLQINLWGREICIMGEKR